MQLDSLSKFYKRDIPFTNDRVKDIEKICKDNNAMLLVCIIPSCNTGQEKSPLQYVKDFYGLFPDQPFFESHNFTHADYDKADGHFNEQGHKKYADFLFSIIDSAERSNIKK